MELIQWGIGYYVDFTTSFPAWKDKSNLKKINFKIHTNNLQINSHIETLIDSQNMNKIK